MAIGTHEAKFLLFARERGVDFRRTLTVGRQAMLLSPLELSNVLTQFGYYSDQKQAASLIENSDGYCEDFVRSIGAETVDSIDNSDYESAAITHDMNKPVASSLKRSYSVVIDGGALEHIFNLPVAFRNCLEMVEIGGHFLSIAPANNFFGHGFYQFSPELFFSVLTERNGFEIVEVIAYETRKGGRWYKVSDPSLIGGRTDLVNNQPVCLLVISKRVNDADPLTEPPQQSDYQSVWESAATSFGDTAVRPDQKGSMSGVLLGMIPGVVKRTVKWALKGKWREYPGFSASHFRRFDPVTEADIRAREPSGMPPE